MASTLPFVKGHGTENDFVLVTDEHGERRIGPDEVRALCDRRAGVGADGLIVAVRTDRVQETLPDGDPAATWFMDYRNADGSIAEMCGNGIRVFVAYLLAEGLAEEPGADGIAISTRAGTRRVWRSPDGFAVDLGPWRAAGGEPVVSAPGVAVPRPGLGIDVGNPHVVVALAGDEELDAAVLDAPPTIDPAPPAGANVEFVVPAEPLVVDGVARIRMRVHERGSGETRSCGTGVAAAALATRSWAGPAAPDRWEVTVPGGTLGVRVTREADGEHVVLSGPAELVYRGEARRP